MKGFYSLVQLLSTFGVIVSLIICIFIPPFGIVLLIVNICAISSASKEIEKAENKGRK
jgi:hypothetical protein|nr:MAG TPA: hypothetical protein [Caudoviricetes sp.]